MKYSDDPLKRKNLIFTIFDSSDMINAFDVSLQKFSSFCDEAEKLYNKNSNPYHNYEHGITGKSLQTDPVGLLPVS